MADEEAPIGKAEWTPEQIAVGQRLKAAREATGLSVEKFAAAIGVKPPTVYRNEAGQPPSIKTLRAWADACSVTMDYLAGREVSEPSANEPPAATGTEG